MKTTVKKKRPILALLILLIGIVLIASSSFFFTRLDQIVNGDLYNYGLQFNIEWINQYWSYSLLMRTALEIAMIATGASIAFVLIHSRTRKNAHKILTCALLVFGAFMIGVAAFYFTKIDYLVHVDLYRYGLQFSSEWADQYWTYAKLLLGLQGTTVAMSTAAATGIFFSDRLKTVSFLRTTRLNLVSIPFRNIPRRKLRNSLTVLAIILGVTLMVGVNIAFDNVYSQFRDTVNQAAGKVDINIRSALDIPFNQSILTTVKETDGVGDAYARANSIVNASNNEGWVSAIMIGVDSNSDFDYLDTESTNITGTRPLEMNSTNAVVDERLNCTIGEIIMLNATIYNSSATELTGFNFTVANFTVVGIYHPSPLEAEYAGFFGGDYADYTIFVDMIQAQTVLEYGSEVNSISLKVTDIEMTDQVVEELSSELGGEYIVNPIKKSISGTIETATSGLNSGLQIMSVMALCVAIVIVLNTMYMNVSERTHEIGILRSQGASTRQVFWIFFSESLILGIIGVLVGLVAGMMVTDVFRYLTARVFQPFSPGLSFKFNFFSVNPQHLILGASAGMLTVILGGIFPSLKACKTDIINALRPSIRGPGKSRTALKLVAVGLPLTIIGSFIYIGLDYFWEYEMGIFITSALIPVPMIGITLLSAGLLRSASPVIEHILVLFGKTRKIISRNIERNLLRSTICFALIGMSLNLVIVMDSAQTGTVMGVENVVRSFSSSDLTITSKELIENSFADNLTAVDETAVNCTTPVLIVPQRTTLSNNMSNPMINSSATIMTINSTSYDKAMSMTFSEDTPSDVFKKLNESGTIILTSPLATSLNATVNDEIKMNILSLVEVPVTIPNPELNSSTIPDNPDPSAYNDTIPDNLPSPPITIPSTITIYVPQIETTYVNFTVIGIAKGAWLEIMSFGSFPLSEACYISYSSLNETYPKYNNVSNLFFIKANPDQNVDNIRDLIKESYGNEYELSVTTYNDAVERVRTSIDEIFYILYSVVIFAVCNASIGVAAIMIMNISERRREIGILRSQGMSRSQVVVSIVGEATCLGVVGFLSGTAIGLILQRAVVSYMYLEGFPMPYIIPYEAIMVTLVLAIVTAIISAVYPANRASRLDIVDALRH
jgi:putative ABC transport system permease protein